MKPKLFLCNKNCFLLGMGVFTVCFSTQVAIRVTHGVSSKKCTFMAHNKNMKKNHIWIKIRTRKLDGLGTHLGVSGRAQMKTPSQPFTASK